MWKAVTMEVVEAIRDNVRANKEIGIFSLCQFKFGVLVLKNPTCQQNWRVDLSTLLLRQVELKLLAFAILSMFIVANQYCVMIMMELIF